ncbi:hypothetical protein [Microbacterium sp. Bi128]|uniref:hypothetical protein n=1 Tax=Microbacterium sp. Bi128 TaxID=2821115 RepID=UPI001DCB7A41|nr:hypothetical protein [Microbacterium sp. Bi128]CAH0137850.1 hypothetical protein SRABI128_00232 [Microbacterium sp. Bi128]
MTHKKKFVRELETRVSDRDYGGEHTKFLVAEFLLLFQGAPIQVFGLAEPSNGAFKPASKDVHVRDSARGNYRSLAATLEQIANEWDDRGDHKEGCYNHKPPGCGNDLIVHAFPLILLTIIRRLSVVRANPVR